MIKKYIAVVTMLVFIIALDLAAQDQTLNLTKSLSKVSTSQKMAVSSDTGNILVVFNLLDVNNSRYSRVYAVILKKQNDGSYKKGAPRLISPDADWHGRPAVGYVAARKQFLVLWDNSDPAKPFGQSSILGRWINRKTGKPKGGQFVMVGTSARNVFPALFMISGEVSDISAPKEEPFAFLFFSRYPIPGGAAPAGELDLIGTYYRPLRYESPKIIPQADDEVKADNGNIDGGWYLNYFVEGGGFSRIRYAEDEDVAYGGTYYGNEQVRNAAITTRGFLRSLTINDDLKTVNNINIRYFDPHTTTMAKAFISQNGDAVVFAVTIRRVNVLETHRVTQSFDDKLNISLNYNTAFKGKSITHSTFLETSRLLHSGYSENETRPAKQTVAWQLSAAKDAWVYKRKVLDSGKPTGPMKKLFTHGNRIQSLISEIIPLAAAAGNQRHNSIAVWQKKISDTKHELIVQLFSVK